MLKIISFGVGILAYFGVIGNWQKLTKRYFLFTISKSRPHSSTDTCPPLPLPL